MSSAEAVVLVSGGMDSCVTAAIAVGSHGAERTAFLHASYGQRTEEKERACFSALADHFGVALRLAARLDHMKLLGGSSLTDLAIPVPAADLSRRDIPPTYVPFRNAQLLSIGVAWAEALRAGSVYIGAVEEDSSGYPDCRRSFFDAFERAVDAGTRPETEIRIVTPVIHMRKSEIVRRGIQMGAPFELTWSCYQDSAAACGNCDSCALRLRAFREAGMKDPLEYRPSVPGVPPAPREK